MQIHRWVNHGHYSIAENKLGEPVALLKRLDDDSYQSKSKRLKRAYISSEGVVRKR